MENKLGMGYTIDPNNPNIIDGEGIEIESIPIHEGDEIGMDRMPSSMNVETGERNFTNGVKVKEVKKEKKCYPIVTKIIFLGLLIGALAKDQDKIINLYNNSKNILTKFNAEKNITEETDYDTALAEAGAIVEEPEEKEEAPQVENETQQIEEEGAYDEVIGGKVLAFTDPYDDDQVYARAEAIYIYLQKSNVKDITIEELCNQIKFVNGTYNAATDDEAWDVHDDFLQTIADYSVATEQSNNFAGGVVDDNGVHAALGLDAFLPDNCEHREIIDEVATKFINLLTATTMEDMMDASGKVLKLEADLKEGKKETSNGTKIYFTSLSSSEGMITGLMFQLSNAIIHSSIGEDATITYKDNMGQDVKVTLGFLETYYNPQCNGEYDPENVWAICCTDLVETAIAKGLDLTPSR